MTQLVKPALERQGSTPNQWVTAARFPAPHGFTTRQGGVSEGPLASLNLGYGVGDVRARVDENFRRLCEAAALSLADLHTVNQVHGTAVHLVGTAQRGRASEGTGVPADALVTSEAGVAVAVRVADCVPILIADPKGRRVAAVHSGWRGTLAEVLASAVEAMVGQGTQPADVHVAVGPGIRSCCYVVSLDLARQFKAKFGAASVILKDGQIHLDLVRGIHHTLGRVGVPQAHIEVLADCTSCTPGRYFSHRRDQGNTGRHLGFVACSF